MNAQLYKMWCGVVVVAGLLGTVTAGAADTDQYAGLRAWYRFDEGSGTYVSDSSGNGLHGYSSECE